MACVPGLLERILVMPGFAACAGTLDLARLTPAAWTTRK